MELEKIRAKIIAKQKMLNIETDQNVKNEILHQIQLLNMRKDIEETKEKINNLNQNNHE